MPSSQHDVIVAGAGPAGSSCATFCAQRGMRVLLLDRARFPRAKVCGDFLNPRCWPVFERLRVAEAVVALPHHKTTGFLFSTLGGRTIQVEFAEEIRRQHRAVAVSRKLLDHCLLEQARAAGVEVWEEATLVGAKREESGWKIEVQTAEGRRVVAAPTLVGADGRHTLVGRRAGLLRREATDERVGVQFLFRCQPQMSDCIQLHQLRDGYCGAVKIGDGLADVAMVTPKRMAHEANVGSLRDNPVLARFLGNAEPVEKPRSITPILGAEFAPCGGGVLLVGDAARVIEPFTGQGICFALRSGELAAEAIARGDLGSYAAALDVEYQLHARTNRIWREVLWRGWAARGAVRLAQIWPRWIEGAVASVIRATDGT